MNRSFLRFLIAALVFSVVVSAPFLPLNQRAALDVQSSYRLEVEASVGDPASFQVFWNSSEGLTEENSARHPLRGTGKPEKFAVAIPNGTYRTLRIDPLDRSTRLVFHSLRLVDPNGNLVIDLLADNLRPVNQIEAVNRTANGLEVTVPAGAVDPQFEARIPSEIELSLTKHPLSYQIASTAWPILVGAVLLYFVFTRFRGQLGPRVSKLWIWGSGHPVRFLALVAFASALLAAYPVVFFGKSYVSPNLGGTSMLYNGYPTLPGSEDREIREVKGSDVGAIMWAFLPYGPLHRDAYLHGELPLWNRYNAGGTTLLGQGQSMVGDPLMFLVSLVGGHAWAWDMRYIVAHWYFALGLSWCVWALTRHLGASTLVAGTALLIGFFNYRVNHPAIFSICAAPWVLLSWIQLLKAERPAHERWALAGLTLANILLLCSGTVKEAYMLVVSMNLTGLILVVSDHRPLREKMRLLLLAACAGAVFACLSAPSWLVFLHQLGKAFTTYNIAHTMQIQPTFALGFIDELFYRPLSQGEWVFNPSINFLFFIGAAYVLITLRTSGRDPFIRGLLLSAVFPAALAFGLVPPSWIVRTPFLGNVVHIDNTFSCALIVLTIVIAGCGFAIAARRLGSEEGKADIALIAAVCAPFIWLWIGAGQAVHRSSFGPGRVYSPLKTTHDYETAPFIWITLAAILIAAFGGLLLARRSLRTRSVGAATVSLFLTCGVVFFWRHAIHLDSVGFGKYTNHAPPREDFYAKSEAVEAVRKTQAEAPTRAVGLRNALFPGFNGLIGIEGIHGPDALVNPYFRDFGSIGPIKRAWEWRFDVGPLDVQRARPFFDFLNVRYYLHANTDRETLRAELSPVLQADLDVYESPTVWPRAFFVDEIISYRAPTQLIERVLETKRPFAALNDGELSRETHAPLRLLVRRRPTSVAKPARDYTLSPNGTSFTIDATGPGVAVLHETFHRRDFKATIDGKPAEVLRVNHAFRGVYVSKPGTHRIDIWYHPEGYTMSLILFGIGVAMAFGGVYLHRRLRPETNAHAP